MAKNTLIEKQRNRGFFGRRLGRRLNKSREALIRDSLDRLGIDGNNIPPTLASLFPLPRGGRIKEEEVPIWMEIGFGDGHHLAGLMERYPDINFIGIEPYINGMGNFLHRISQNCLSRESGDLEPEDQKRSPLSRGKHPDNIQVHMDDAIPLLHKMPDGCLERLYVLNPDPWPKMRHHKRRIINQEHLDLFSRLLKPGSWLVMATDVDDLAEWMVTECSKHPDFEWTAESSEDWTRAPDWWEVTTRYAQKGLEAGRRESYLVFKKT